MKCCLTAILAVFPLVVCIESRAIASPATLQPPAHVGQALPGNAASCVAAEPRSLDDSGVVVEKVEYRGILYDDRAEFTVKLELKALSSGACLTVIDGPAAVLAKRLPADVLPAREENRYMIVCSKPGRKMLEFHVLAGAEISDSWRVISFAGPRDALVASFDVETAAGGVEARMDSGIPVESGARGDRSFTRGLLESDGIMAVRWRSRVQEKACLLYTSPSPRDS